MEPTDLAEVLARWERGELGAVASADDVAAVRDELEEAARDASAAAAAGGADLSSNPIRLSKRRITDLLACERHLVLTADEGRRGGPADEALHIGVLVDALAEHHVMTTRARLEPEPLELGLDLCRARGDEDTVVWVEALDRDARSRVAEVVDEKRTAVLARWPAFEPRWWARTQERAQVALGDGDVVLTGRADVTVGGPPTPWPVLVVEVKSGTFSIEQRDDGLVYALVLALRDGVAPAAAVTATVGAGVHVEVATADRLNTAAHRLAVAIRAAGELAGGRPPVERPGFRCDRCPVRTSCAAALAVASSP